MSSNMDSSQISKLIRLFFERRYSKNLEDKILHWLASSENSEAKEQAMRLQWEALPNIEDISSKAQFEKIKKHLGFNEEKKKNRLSIFLPRVAAVLLPLIIFIGIYHFTKEEKDDSIGQTIAFAVPYGTHDQKKLICGSEVWVNSGSEIHYNENPNDSARIVNLEGEAYFSVKRHNDIPFIVSTKYLDVKVLGTQFNVSAYPEEDLTIVTLNEGAIAIQTVDKRNFNLKPNQQLIYNNETKETVIRNIDTNTAKDIADWTTGKIIFNNDALKRIVMVLERKYNISIEVDNDVDLNRSYTVRIDAGDSLNEITEVFECLDSSLSYEIETNKIHISNNKNRIIN